MKRRHHLCNVVGIVLSSSIERDNETSSRGAHAAAQRAALSGIAAMLDNAQGRDVGLKLLELCGGIIPRAVIDEDDLHRGVMAHRICDFPGERSHILRLVLDRNDHR